MNRIAILLIVVGAIMAVVAYKMPAGDGQALFVLQPEFLGLIGIMILAAGIIVGISRGT
jgi:vacuolar-type H+-ATPase subunit I/STV1